MGRSTASAGQVVEVTPDTYVKKATVRAELEEVKQMQTRGLFSAFASIPMSSESEATSPARPPPSSAEDPVKRLRFDGVGMGLTEPVRRSGEGGVVGGRSGSRRGARDRRTPAPLGRDLDKVAVSPFLVPHGPPSVDSCPPPSPLPLFSPAHGPNSNKQCGRRGAGEVRGRAGPKAWPHSICALLAA